MQKQPPEKFCKKAVLKTFAIFTGKHLTCVGESFQVRIYREVFQSTYFKEHLQTAASENVHKTEKS